MSSSRSKAPRCKLIAKFAMSISTLRRWLVRSFSIQSSDELVTLDHCGLSLRLKFRITTCDETASPPYKAPSLFVGNRLSLQLDFQGVSLCGHCLQARAYLDKLVLKVMTLRQKCLSIHRVHHQMQLDSFLAIQSRLVT